MEDEGVEIKCRTCIVFHLDSEEYSIHFHFERVWNGEEKEKWGVVSSWKG